MQTHGSFAAPARINILGEHTDYTGGLVLPMAIPFYSRGSISAMDGVGYTFESDLFAATTTVPMAQHVERSRTWSDYPIGVLLELEKLGYKLPAFRLHLSGNIPLGAGLSSSASVEVASCLAMLSLAGAKMSPAEVALLCQRAENQFVGSPCGIMDQFVIVAAKAHHALLIDTRDLTLQAVPLDRGTMQDACILVVNSMVKHSIAEGGYGDRRTEVEAGQAALRERVPAVTDLGHASPLQLEECAPYMSRESFLRCRHIITENERVRQVQQALLEGSAERVGEIMVQAHASQRDDFECSCAEIDFLVDAAIQLDGCFGARMTGGGFGGCTVNLVRRGSVATFTAALKEQYERQFGVVAQAYQCEAVDGAMGGNAAPRG